jgi:hypothetical protein
VLKACNQDERADGGEQKCDDHGHDLLPVYRQADGQK